MGRHRMTSSVPRQCADRSDDEGLYSYVCLTVSHKVSGDQRQTVWGHCEGCIVRLMLEERGGWSWRRLSRSWPPPGPGSRKVHATSAVRGVVHCPHVPIRLGPFLGRHRVTPRCPERQLVCSKGRMYTDESCEERARVRVLSLFGWRWRRRPTAPRCCRQQLPSHGSRGAAWVLSANTMP